MLRFMATELRAFHMSFAPMTIATSVSGKSPLISSISITYLRPSQVAAVPSESASSADRKQARGARPYPAPICPMPCSR